MSIDEQFEIIKAFQRGEIIYIKEKYRDDWLQMKITNNENYKFNFEEYEYALKKPKTFQEKVNDIRDPKEALDYTIKSFKERGLLKLLQIENINSGFFSVCKHVSALEENDLWELWDIAMKYGQENPFAGKIEEISASTN